MNPYDKGKQDLLEMAKANALWVFGLLGLLGGVEVLFFDGELSWKSVLAYIVLSFAILGFETLIYTILPQSVRDNWEK